MKKSIEELAIFGGEAVFSSVRPTSNFVQPEPDRFFSYARSIYDNHHITNNGPILKELESRLAELHETKFCVAVCSGFLGLMLAMRCLAIDGKNEIIMPSLTYRRMADIAFWSGLVPHFCDVDPETLGMSSSLAETCINENTALMLGVHQQVNLCDIDGLLSLSKKYNVPILFDAVEAAYASHNGIMVGSFGEAECFSMHASKFLNGFEGGYITTSNAELADRIMKMRTFGFFGKDQISELGLNAKLNEIHAAMALANLDDVEGQVLRNKERYNVYKELLADVEGVELLLYEEAEKRGYKNIIIKLNDSWGLSRDNTLKVLHAENMLARGYYESPLHTKNTSYPVICGSLPVTEKLSKEYMCLPSGEFVSNEDVAAIVDVFSFLQDQGKDVGVKLQKMLL